MYTVAEYDLVNIGRSGSGSINAKVDGFWSGSSITLYVTRQFGGGWDVSVSNSSGGRDSKEVACDMVAYKNYAAALSAMCDVGLELKSAAAHMEAAYQVQRESERQVRLEKEAAEKALFDADERLGEVKAAMLVEEMALTGKYVRAVRRGTTYPLLVEVERRAKTKFYFAGSIIAKKDLVAKLAEMSARTCFPAELMAA